VRTVFRPSRGWHALKGVPYGRTTALARPEGRALRQDDGTGTARRACPTAGRRQPDGNLPMFTLEESALLGRMLRFVGWTIVLVALAAVGYLLFR